MLSKLNSQRYAGYSMVNADSDHQIYERSYILLHSKGNTLEYGVETESDE